MDESIPVSRRTAAEGLAAFALVFAGGGAAVTNAWYDDTLGTVGIALVFGLVIMVMVYATDHLSGAHLNPAVTMAFVLTRHFPRTEATANMAAQLAGRAGRHGPECRHWQRARLRGADDRLPHPSRVPR